MRKNSLGKDKLTLFLDSKRIIGVCKGKKGFQKQIERLRELGLK